MKRTALIAFAVLGLCSVSKAQLSVSVITRTPMPPSLTAWQNDRTLFQIIVTNPAGGNVYNNVRIGYTLRDAENGRIVAQSLDNSPFMPRFNLPPGPSVLTLFGPDFINANAILFDQSLRTQIVATNSMPEGVYEFCIRVLDEQGTSLAQSGEVCRWLTIVVPDPPMLIYPSHKQSLPSETLPNFIWSPVTAAGGIPARYILRISPVFEGQNERFAIDYNEPLFEKKDLLATTFLYPPSALPFKTYPMAKGFAWQIQAVDFSGQPATRNDGKSEIYLFNFRNAREGIGNDDKDSSDRVGTEGDGAGFADGEGNNGSNGGDSVSGGGNDANPQRLTHVWFGEFSVTLERPMLCTNISSCTINGTGKILLPFHRDSSSVILSGVGVRFFAGKHLSVSGLGRVRWQADAMRFPALNLYPQNVDLTVNGAEISGSASLDWSVLGLGAKSSSIQLSGVLLTRSGIKASGLELAFSLSGAELGFGNCVNIAADSLFFSIADGLSPALSGTVSMTAKFPCLQTDAAPLEIYFPLPIDNPNADNLLLTFSTPGTEIFLAGSRYSFQASALLVDLSGSSNFAGIEPSAQCAGKFGWSDPIWRGVVVADGTWNIAGMYDNTITIVTKAALLEPDGNRLLASIAGKGPSSNFAFDGFSFKCDSSFVRICRDIPETVALTGMLSMPDNIVIPTEWKRLNSLPTTIAADASWNWSGKAILPENGLPLRFGDIAEISLKQALLTLQPRGARLQLSNMLLSAPAGSYENHSIGIGGISIHKTGVVLENSGWTKAQRSDRTGLLSIAGIEAEISEAGFGYRDGVWFCGFSGAVLVPEEAGLTGERGIEVKRLVVKTGERISVESEAVEVAFGIGGLTTAKGTLQWQSAGETAGGIRGNVSMQIPGICSEVSGEFFLGSSASNILHWQISTAQPLNPCQSNNKNPVRGILLGMGWNTRFNNIDGNTANALLFSNQTQFDAPKATAAAAPLSLRYIALSGDPHLQYIQLAKTVVVEQGSTQGVFSPVADVNIAFAAIPSLGFLQGVAEGQISLKSFETDAVFGGVARLNIAGKEFADARVALRSGIDNLSISSEIPAAAFKLFDKQTETESAFALLQLRNPIFTLEANGKLTLNADGEVLDAASGLATVGGKEARPMTGVSISNIQDGCLKTQLSIDSRSASIDLLGSWEKPAQTFVSTDILPCLNPGIARYATTDAFFSIRDGLLQWKALDSASSGDSCITPTLFPAKTQHSVSGELRWSSDIRERGLSFGGNRGQTIVMHELLKTAPTTTTQGKTAMAYAAFSLAVESNNPTVRSCEDVVGNTPKQSSLDLFADIALRSIGDVLVIENTGQTSLPAGTKVRLQWRRNKRKSHSATIRLQRPLPAGVSLPLRMTSGKENSLDFSLISSSASLPDGLPMEASISLLGTAKENNTQNNNFFNSNSERQ